MRSFKHPSGVQHFQEFQDLTCRNGVSWPICKPAKSDQADLAYSKDCVGKKRKTNVIYLEKKYLIDLNMFILKFKGSNPFNIPVVGLT